VQIWDNDPGTLAAVAGGWSRSLAPARSTSTSAARSATFRKSPERAYLLRYPDRVGQIVARVAAACAPVPVTAKIRLGCTRDTINAIDVAKRSSRPAARR